jgi:NDP-sugar pyrophosphorylase family protein
MKAMLLAAGLGTRLKPFTDNHPKALALVNNKSLLQRNIEYLMSYGFDEIIVNVHHFAEQIVNTIHENNGWGATISISDEQDQVLETGGGLLKASNFFSPSNDSFLLMNVDILTDLNLHQMLAFHQKENPLATLAIRKRDTSRYLMFNENNVLVGWKNISTNETKEVIECTHQSLFAFSGIQIINPIFFEKVNMSGKFSMIDAYLKLAPSNIIKGFDHSDSQMIDVGKPESIEKAAQLFA